jgi:dTDP-4-dehydrorhamnose reductase
VKHRALVFGSSGQVGRALCAIAPQGFDVVAHDFAETDIRDESAVAATLDTVRPDVIINCAAFTAVDDAELRPAEAFSANAEAPGFIAQHAVHRRIRVIHISTDYVFDGRSNIPYSPAAEVAPINVYGATKLEGERRVLGADPAHVVVRTAWVHSATGTNFIKTCVRVLSAGTVMRVVDDQIGTPTRALHLAGALWRIADAPHLQGLLHFTDAGVASWYDVATAVLETLRSSGHAAEGAGVVPIGSEAFQRPAKRPQFSVLDKRSSWDVIGLVPPHWREGVIASTTEVLGQ